jgi:hypothetical protein
MMSKSADNEPIDLASFDSMVARQETGLLIPILGPDGKSRLGFSISVAGPDSARALTALDEIQQEMIAEASLQPTTSSDSAQRRLRYFAKVTIAFVPDVRPDGTTPDVAVKLDGSALPCTEENVAKLYGRFRFILAQVQAKADTRTAFLDG